MPRKYLLNLNHQKCGIINLMLAFVAMLSPFLIIFSLIAILTAPHFFVLDKKFYLPENFRKSELLFHYDATVYTSGCGFYIFKLDQNTSSQIIKSGISYLENKQNLSKNTTSKQAYSHWKETPVGDYVYAMNAFSNCGSKEHGNLDPNLEKLINQEIDTGHGYYAFTRTTERVIIVLPRESFVIVAFKDR
jgi:hypothetical protein